MSVDIKEPLPVPIGGQIGEKYRVDRILGRGGMGVVLSCQHLELGRQVAVKILHPSLASSTQVVQRFAREARSAAKIESEHVARVIDVGSLPSKTDGPRVPFMVMEHLNGCDLRARMEQGALPVELAVDYLLQACVGVAEAHAHGIVHRDLKPSNLFLADLADGTAIVKVLDFGISKALDPYGTDAGETTLTRPTDVFGSPRYMSPEQLRSARDVDARSDIWALGVVLYELLTLVAPFGGGSVPEVHAAILSTAPRPIGAHRDDVPEGLWSAIACCFNKEVDQRYDSVLQLARALAPFGSSEAGRHVARVERWDVKTASASGRITPLLSLVDDPSEPGQGAEPSSRDPELASASSAAPGREQPGAETASTWGQDSQPAPRFGARRGLMLAAAALLLVTAALLLPRLTQQPSEGGRTSSAAGSVVSESRTTAPPASTLAASVSLPATSALPTVATSPPTARPTTTVNPTVTHARTATPSGTSEATTSSSPVTAAASSSAPMTTAEPATTTARSPYEYRD